MTSEPSANSCGGTSSAPSGAEVFWAQEAGGTKALGQERPMRIEEPKDAQRGQSVFEQGRERSA